MTSTGPRSISAQVESLAGRSERGRWMRAFPSDPRREETSILEGVLHGGRFNPPCAFPVLYASERQQDFRSYVSQMSRAYTSQNGKVPTTILLADLSVTLGRVLDLADLAIRRVLHVSMSDLIGPRDMSIPQCIGAAAYRAGFDGIVYPRPLGKGDRNVVVFLDRVNATHVKVLSATLLRSA